MFTEKERGIFQYFHPEKGKIVYADPMLIDMRLRKASAEDDMDIIMERLQSPIPDLYEEGVTRILPIAYKAFGMKPVDEDTGEGVPAATILEVYTDFLNFRADLKKNTSDSPDGSQPTDGPHQASVGSGEKEVDHAAAEQPKEEGVPVASPPTAHSGGSVEPAAPAAESAPASNSPVAHEPPPESAPGT